MTSEISISESFRELQTCMYDKVFLEALMAGNSFISSCLEKGCMLQSQFVLDLHMQILKEERAAVFNFLAIVRLVRFLCSLTL